VIHGSRPADSTMAKADWQADAGFHEGELTAQRRAGVEAEAARLSRMLQPVELDSGIAAFLADRTFAAITGRDAFRHVWVSPLTGPPGFLHVAAPTRLEVHTRMAQGDPLYGFPASQRVGTVVVDFAARRRVRVNGTLVESGDDRLVIEVEQAYGNCPRYIQPRILILEPLAEAEAPDVRYGTSLSRDDVELIRGADTFFLGTTNPKRGSDAAHRGGPPGFVRVDADRLWWPDYAGNNVFNSFGNLEVDPEAALLFPDFATGATLQLSGTAEVDWGELREPVADSGTGRSVLFTVQRVVAGYLLRASQVSGNANPSTPI
jgi:uncharacterized protein